MTAIEVAAQESATTSPVREGPAWDGYALGFALLVLGAGLLRFWDLGPRAMHHDESLHALYSWYLYVRGEYRHDPLMHGPFQFHIIALAYFLLGASDYAARSGAALFGTIAVALPYLLRPWLGLWGALASSALLAVSPLLLYYSRFARGDIYVVVWNLLLVIALWRYFRSEQRGYLWLGAAALSLAFATKEVTYLTALIFGSYLFFVTARELWARVKEKVNLRGVSPQLAFFIVFWTLVLPQGAAAVLLAFDVLGLDPVAWGAWRDPNQPEVARFMYAGSDPVRTFLLVTSTLAPLFAISLAVAARWNLRLWLGAAAFFYVPYVLLYTTFFSNLQGFGSGIWGGLEYWIAQQPVARGSQPWFYYLLLIPLYEFLALALGATGALIYGAQRLRPRLSADTEVTKERHAFTGFLLWWLAGSLALYGYAGEKMPWLSLHILLPLSLLAGQTAGSLIGRVPWRVLWDRRAFLLLPLLVLALLALRALGDAAEGLQPGPSAWAGVLKGLGAFGVFLAIIVGLYRITRGLSCAQAGWGLVAGLLAVMAAFTLRAAWQASFLHGDIPVEMMVYTQTSPELPRVFARIERIAAETGQGRNLPITVDANQGFTWPWAWYLRDYRNVDYPDMAAAQADPRGSVVILNANNQRAVEPFLTKYESGQRFPHRWWFPEFYKEGEARQLLGSLFTPEGRLRIWNYLYARDVGVPLGSSDAVVYYPKGSLTRAPGSGDLTAQPTDTPARGATFMADLVIGARGGSPGGLQSPKGVALDAQGNLYLVDSDASRVTKYDASGRPVAQQGSRGNADGQFTEPWGIAVDRAGNVYVADTWNHRVQKLDPDLRFLTKWGTFASAPAGGAASPGSFYGPRAIAFDAAGNVLVTDTGNKRIQKFTPNGEFLAAYGTAGRGPGQLQEPVGIVATAAGEFLVADTWNRRVQRFDREFRYLGEFTVAGWAGQSVVNKPYLAVDGSGNVLLTDPEAHKILKYSPSGELLGAYGRIGSDLSSFNLPAALVVDSQGRVFVSDSVNARVMRLPPLE